MCLDRGWESVFNIIMVTQSVAQTTHSRMDYYIVFSLLVSKCQSLWWFFAAVTRRGRHINTHTSTYGDTRSLYSLTHNWTIWNTLHIYRYWRISSYSKFFLWSSMCAVHCKWKSSLRIATLGGLYFRHCDVMLKQCSHLPVICRNTLGENVFIVSVFQCWHWRICMQYLSPADSEDMVSSFLPHSF